MTPISWMIVELPNIVGSQEETIEGLAHHRTLFPAPAMKEEASTSAKSKRLVTTYVSHGSRAVNSVQMLSILRAYHLGRANLQFHRVAMHARCGDFSMDQGEKAIFEYLSATCHLPMNLGTSSK